MYSILEVAAQHGDEDARRLKASVDDYVRKRGIEVKDLDVPKATATAFVGAGVNRIRVDDGGPWTIRVAADPDLDGEDSVAAYAALRHASLRSLAAEPMRNIRVAISPRRFMSLAEFRGSLCSGACRIDYVVVDVFGPAGWVMASGRSIDRGQAAVAGQALEETLREQASASLDQFSGLDPRGLRFSVRQVIASMTAEQAVAASQHPDALVIDPLTDLEDSYRGRAAFVEVVGAPDLFAVYADLVLGQPLLPAYAPVR
ncbi:MAG TPA: hypothetical protein VLM76_11350 [Patescibacteria group bacterium]|nr:hypothetical protein [Patescibacteria group bacterium]